VTIECALCHEPIPNLRAKGVLTEVTGWVADRTGGGVHHVIARRSTGRYAHNACAEEEKLVTTQQIALNV
jgi:hypothetical protein